MHKRNVTKSRGKRAHSKNNENPFKGKVLSQNGHCKVAMQTEDIRRLKRES